MTWAMSYIIIHPFESARALQIDQPPHQGDLIIEAPWAFLHGSGSEFVCAGWLSMVDTKKCMLILFCLFLLCDQVGVKIAQALFDIQTEGEDPKLILILVGHKC